MAAKSVDRDHTGMRPRGGSNRSQVFTASMLTVLRIIRLSVGLAAGTQVCMRVCENAVVTEPTSGVAFPYLHSVAFGTDMERRRSRCGAHGALI